MEAFMKDNPDLMLLDISLPDIPAMNSREHYLVITTSVKIIAQTAFAGTSNRKKALAAGGLEHLGKPLKPQVLIETVARNLA